MRVKLYIYPKLWHGKIIYPFDHGTTVFIYVEIENTKNLVSVTVWDSHIFIVAFIKI